MSIMDMEKTIWSVVGARGCAGKSTLSVNIGVALARRGGRVLLVDADPGGGSLHRFLGIKRPGKRLEDLLRKRSGGLSDLTFPTLVPGLRLLSGPGFVEIANPRCEDRGWLVRRVNKLKADHIIVDLGEGGEGGRGGKGRKGGGREQGSSVRVLDFFAFSDEAVMVLVPEPAAVQNSYKFLKSFVYRRLERLFSGTPRVLELIKDATDKKSKDRAETFSELCEKISRVDSTSAALARWEIKKFRPKLILNMAAPGKDLEAADLLASSSRKYLDLEVSLIGTLRSSEKIENSVKTMRPFMLDESAVGPRSDVEEIVFNLLNAGEVTRPKEDRRAAKEPLFGFNDNITHQGEVFHVQTEVIGESEPVVETVIYLGGRIFFSKKRRLKELDSQKKEKHDLLQLAKKQHKTAIAAIKMNKFELDEVKK